MPPTMPAMDTTTLHAAARRRANELRNAAIADAIERVLAFLFRRSTTCHS